MIKSNDKYEHMYKCTVLSKDSEIDHVYECPKLPVILKAIKVDTDYRFKIPHGNKVRTLILEQGSCHIVDPDTNEEYIITIRRWKV
jgi:hypothetical protein